MVALEHCGVYPSLAYFHEADQGGHFAARGAGPIRHRFPGGVPIDSLA